MARLKFDRKINITMKSRETIIIPEDEVWKVTIPTDPEYNGIKQINTTDYSAQSNGQCNLVGGCYLFGGGTRFSTLSRDGAVANAFISGIAFKIAE